MPGVVRGHGSSGGARRGASETRDPVDRGRVALGDQRLALALSREAVPRTPSGHGLLTDGYARTIRYLRVSITQRCNLRCLYCRPQDEQGGEGRGCGVADAQRPDAQAPPDRSTRQLARAGRSLPVWRSSARPSGGGEREFGGPPEELTASEILAIVEALSQAGVERVRLTGGEPLLRADAIEVVSALRTMATRAGRPLAIVMTTNGLLLARDAQALAAAGLDEVTVSVDSLQPARFASMTGGGALTRVLKGIERAREVGLDVKINTVVLEGENGDELAALAVWAWQRGATPRFIEPMPMAGGRLYRSEALLPAQGVRDRIAKGIGAPLSAEARDGNSAAGPARYFRVESGRWRGRRVGTIAAMTEGFCDLCNRVRLASDGRLHGCLGHDEAYDLRDALARGGSPAVLDEVRRALAAKQQGHTFARDGRGGPRKAMIGIGG